MVGMRSPHPVCTGTIVYSFLALSQGARAGLPLSFWERGV